MPCPFPSEFPSQGGALGAGSGFSRGQGPRVEELGTQERTPQRGYPVSHGHCQSWSLCPGCAGRQLPLQWLHRHVKSPHSGKAGLLPSCPGPVGFLVTHAICRCSSQPYSSGCPVPHTPHHAYLVVLCIQTTATLSTGALQAPKCLSCTHGFKTLMGPGYNSVAESSCLSPPSPVKRVHRRVRLRQM